MKRYSLILAVIIVVAAVLFILSKAGLIKTISPEELKSSFELQEVETKWVSKYYQPWPPKLILVPAISFRIKNLTDKPLRYINFNANFRFRDDFENLGDSFLAAIRNEPIMPDEVSDMIFLKSNYGVEGKSLASFKDNPHWKVVNVKLFAQSRGSQYVELGQWEISRKIDFKEPEPVGMEKKKKSEKNKDE